MKKIAVYGYEVYAEESDLSNISNTYVRGRDEQALYNYNMAMTGKAYRERFKNDANYGGFGYDSNDNTCVLFFKQGTGPNITLDKGFKTAACRFSLADLEDGMNKVHALAKQFGWTAGEEYAVGVRFREDYNRPLSEQRNILDIILRDVHVPAYDRFADLLKGLLDEGMYELYLTMV